MTTVVPEDKQRDEQIKAIVGILSTRSFVVDSDSALYQLIKAELPEEGSRRLFDSVMSELITDGMEGKKVVRRRRGRVENISAEQPGIAVFLVPTNQK